MIRQRDDTGAVYESDTDQPFMDEYKKKYGIEDDIRISAVRYDTDRYVEGCFNLLELLDGEYILHLNQNVHLYAESYVKFILSMNSPFL